MHALRLLVLAALICGAAPPPDAPRPSLCISSSITGYAYQGGQWRLSRFQERRYILRQLTDEDRADYPGVMTGGPTPPGVGLFNFDGGGLAGWCSLYNPPFIVPKLQCSGYLGSLDIDLNSGRYTRTAMGGFVSGDPKGGSSSVELGRCTRI